MTPAAVSQQIRHLEEWIGRPLFERKVRAVVLTAEGAAMLPKLREGLAALSAAMAAGRSLEGGVELIVRAPPSFASRWLIPRLARFTEMHPEIALRLSGSAQNIDDIPHVASGERIESPFAENEVVIRYGGGRYPGFRVREIFAPVLVVACSPNLLRGEHPLHSPADLRWHTLIQDDSAGPQAERPTWADWLRAAGVEGVDPARGPRFGNNLALEAAMDGLGVVLVLKPLIAEAVAAGRLVVPFDISVPPRDAYYLVVAESVADRPAVRAFSEWLAAEALADNS